MAFHLPFPPAGAGGPMPGGPAPHIQLGGGDPGAGPPGLPAPPGGGGGIPGQADSPQVTDLTNQAADLLSRALGVEKDPEDKAMLAKIVADLHKFAGSQQKLVDQATGAGPGAKLVRKASPAQGY